MMEKYTERVKDIRKELVWKESRARICAKEAMILQQHELIWKPLEPYLTYQGWGHTSKQF